MGVGHWISGKSVKHTLDEDEVSAEGAYTDDDDGITGAEWVNVGRLGLRSTSKMSHTVSSGEVVTDE